MPRKRLIRTNQFFYHVTTRSNHKDWFELPLEQVWEISKKAFNKAQKNCPSHVAQYVLMANHYHMLVMTPDSNIDKFMYWFNKTFSDELKRSSGKINRMFGSSYKWSLILNEVYFQNVIRYIYQNPLRAKLVKRSENYPFSTLYYNYRNRKSGFLLKPVWDIEKNLDFLNQIPNVVNDLSVEKGLKKSHFSPVFVRKY